MSGWGGRQQRQKSDSSQRGSQGLAACTCVDRPATFRDPPQTVGPRHGLNAAIHARGSSTLVAVVLAKYERRRLPPSVLAQHERTLFASRACLLACSGYHSCLLKRMSANPPARSVVEESKWAVWGVMTACPPSGPAPAAVPAASQGSAVLHGEAIRSLRVATCSVWRWSRVKWWWCWRWWSSNLGGVQAATGCYWPKKKVSGTLRSAMRIIVTRTL